MFQRLWVLVLVVASTASAEYLSDYIVPLEPEPPEWVYGGGYSGRIFAGGIDHWAQGYTRWRSSKHWAWQVNAGLHTTSSDFLVGATCHWLREGNIATLESEDFVEFGAAFFHSDWGQSYLLSLGYGRDLLPWPQAPMGLRLGVGFDFAVWGEEFSRESTGVFGLKERKLARALVSINLSLFVL